MKRFILFNLCVLAAGISFAQKKPLDHSVYDSWQHLGQVRISDNAQFATYAITPQEGNIEFIIENLKNGNKKSIERAIQYHVTPNERFFITKVIPTFEEKKKHKENKGKSKDAPKDSLITINLSNFEVKSFGPIKSYKIGKEGNNFFAYQPVDTTTTKAKKDSLPQFKNPLVIREFGSDWNDTIHYVDKYYFSKNGNQLVALTEINKKDSLQDKNEVIHYDLNKKNKTIIASGYFKYNHPTFNEEGDLLAFYASKDSVDVTDKCFELLLHKLGEDKCETIINTNYTKNLPDRWFFTEHSNIRFSKNSDKLFVSIAPLTEPSDTVTIKEETSPLDIWHYQDPYPQPTQLVNRVRDLNYTYSAVIHMDKPNEIIPLTKERYENIVTPNQGDANYGIALNYSNYTIETQWMGSTQYDIYGIDFKTGKRKLIMEQVYGSVSVSPQGDYVLIYDRSDLNWYTYNLKTDKQVNLTGQLDVNFWDEQHDTPNEPYAYGSAGWLENDQAVILYDANDIWQFDPEGIKEPICLTANAGRNNNLRYRVIKTDKEQRFFKSNEEVLVSLFDTKTKENGFGSLRLNKPAQPKQFDKGQYTVNLIEKAKSKDGYIFIKANFETTPDLHFTKNNWKSVKQLSHINPQMSDYNWGTAELTEWTAFDGVKHEGIIYKPEDFDPNKKYPVMIYFYDRHSDGLYNHYKPEPSWSIINIPFYVSRGYIVFSPDILYQTGMPGESAYNSIISGVEKLTENPWVDKDNMAIQGQSWGGYQVAYLITRTNMFKAAGSGAPVSNMTSAFGGIRWSTGNSRQYQYERGQSRIGGTLWDRPELYILNSPLFRADKIETPLLIMHNDQDGAVPWYQGIELFMGMRRLQKPVWMLQYNNEQHNLVKRVNRKDLTIRLQQFFDHYLKGDPIPVWMDKGVPAIRKGKTWGTELVK